MLSIAEKIDCSPPTLLEGVKKAEAGGRKRAGVLTKTLTFSRRWTVETGQLLQANAILCKAFIYFAQEQLGSSFK